MIGATFGARKGEQDEKRVLLFVSEAAFR